MCVPKNFEMYESTMHKPNWPQKEGRVGQISEWGSPPPAHFKRNSPKPVCTSPVHLNKQETFLATTTRRSMNGLKSGVNEEFLEFEVQNWY